MDRQIIEISNNGFFLSLYRGFLVIENEEKQKQEIPLDNVLSLILSADIRQITRALFFIAAFFILFTSICFKTPGFLRDAGTGIF